MKLEEARTERERRELIQAWRNKWSELIDAPLWRSFFAAPVVLLGLWFLKKAGDE